MIKEKIKNSKIGRVCAKINAKWLACKEKISNRLGSVEEKYNFPFSHIMWHVFTVVSILVCVAGVLLFLWGLTPVFQRNVDEPDYLEQQKIDEAAVLACAQELPVVKKSVNSEGEEIPPVISLDQLQAALPNVQFSKNGRKLICDHSEGYYEYGDFGDWIYPSRCYEMGLVDTYEATKIRNAMQDMFPFDSVSQQNTVDGLAFHLMKYQLVSRSAIYKTSLSWLKSFENREEVLTLWKSVDDVIGNAGDAARTVLVDKVFAQMYDFAVNNPNSVYRYMPVALEVVRVADGSIRLDAFKGARSGYKTLGVDLDAWIDATKQFVALPNLHRVDIMIRALVCFYDLYNAEALERMLANAKMKESYEDELKKAAKEAEEREKVKDSMLPTGGLMIAGGVGVVLIIAILLVLFSMQRTLVRMERNSKEQK